ncbi:hypothetical protein ACQEVS_02675 [Streptomyces sp. CA-181903]
MGPGAAGVGPGADPGAGVLPDDLLLVLFLVLFWRTQRLRAKR